MYINDLCNVSKVLELILFADDTNIFYSHTDASYLMEVVNLELKKITCWFYANKLSINVKKSNFFIFRPRQNRQTLDLAFNISNYSIDRVKEATFLGTILDEPLTWKSHTAISYLFYSECPTEVARPKGTVFTLCHKLRSPCMKINTNYERLSEGS